MTGEARWGELLRKAREAPACAEQLAEVDPDSVASAADFVARVPPARRGPAPFARSLRGGRVPPGAVLMPSSGTSGGLPALGVAGTETEGVDAALRAFFETDRRSTLLLCALPAGVAVSAPSCVSISVGTRTDLAVAALTRLVLPSGPEALQQVIVVAEPLHALELLRAGAAAGVPWERVPLHLALGGGFLPAALRATLRRRLGPAPAGALPRRILSSFGAGEIGLNLLFETPGLAAEHEARSPEAWTERARPLPSPPLLMAYAPERLLVEGVDSGRGPELHLTLLDPDRLRPVLRHPTGDPGGPRAESAPRSPAEREAEAMGLRLAWVYDRATLPDGSPAAPVDELLFSLPATRDAVTGYWLALPRADGLELQVQLAPGAPAPTASSAPFEAALGRPVRLRLLPFDTFPGGGPGQWERKPRRSPA